MSNFCSLLRAAAASLAVCLLIVTSAASSAQTAQALHQRSLAATCSGCHGTDGKAAQGAAMPSLTGLSRDYIVAQMQAFRDGKRPATVMHQLAKGYSNEQIDAIAAYFAARK